MTCLLLKFQGMIMEIFLVLFSLKFLHGKEFRGVWKLGLGGDGPAGHGNYGHVGTTRSQETRKPHIT